MTKPIKPSQLAKVKSGLPDAVFEAFNELIASYWNGSEATFEAKEAAKIIACKMSIDAGKVWALKYLDVEEAYRTAGWKVVYDQQEPEKYQPTFTFRK